MLLPRLPRIAGLVALALLLGLPQSQQQQQTRRRKETGVVSLTSAELVDHLEAWSVDLAVFFYAPWCPYCKIVGPFWDMVGEYHAEVKTRGMVLARFDCERDMDAVQICEYLGVDRYPLLQFFGYGSYYRNDPISSFLFGPRTNVDRSSRFEGPFEPEIMKDWTNMMSGVSAWHRKTEGFWSFLGWAPKRGVSPAALRALQAENQALKEENRWLKKAGRGGGGGAGGRGVGGSLGDPEVEEEEDDDLGFWLGGGKGQGGADEDRAWTDEELESKWAATADELLGEAKGSGDPFTELAQGSLTELEEQAVIACLKEFAGDYCSEYAGRQELDLVEEEEPFCSLFDTCFETDFAGPECRPSKCPFNSPDGCERVKTCLRSGVMSLYEQQVALEPQLLLQQQQKVAASGGVVGGAGSASGGANAENSSDRE